MRDRQIDTQRNTDRQMDTKTDRFQIKTSTELYNKWMKQMYEI